MQCVHLGGCAVVRVLTVPPFRYIPEIKKVTLIKQISPTQSVWTLFYHFPPPVSPRVFTVVQTTWLSTDSPKTGYVCPLSRPRTHKGR